MKNKLLMSALIMIALVALVGIIPAMSMVNATENSILNASELPLGDITEITTVGSFTLGADSTNKFTVDGNNKQSPSGLKFTQRLKTNGVTNGTSRTISFSTSGPATFSIYAMSSSSSATDRTVVLSKNDGSGEMIGSYIPLGSVENSTIPEQTFSIEEAGSYIVTFPVGAINIYYIEVAETEQAITQIFDAGKLADGDITGEVLQDGFTVTASDSKKMTVEANSKQNAEGVQFAKRLKFNGASDGMSRTITFTVTGASSVKAYVLSGSSSAADRQLILNMMGASEPVASFAAPTAAVDNVITPLEYEIADAGTYYFSVDAAINLYYIEVVTGESQEIVRKDWNEVEPPVLGTPVVNSSRITVPYTMVIGQDGADKLTIYMRSTPDGEIIDSASTISFGTEGELYFTPSASGTYYFTAEAFRNDEETTLVSAEAVQAEFLLPLGTPSVRAKTNDSEGTLLVTITKVAEADNYEIHYRLKGDQNYIYLDTVEAGSDDELTYPITGLTIGNTYEILVYALRNDERSNPATCSAIVRNSAELDWNFAWFGTSTSSSRNKLVSGSNIYDGITLLSCTYDPDSMAIKDKGGKFTQDGYDGISFYYTKINALENDFFLKATVRIDYINPNVDGQEGVALLVRDSIGENGVSGKPFYTNSVAAIATKLTYQYEGQTVNIKDGLGYRFVTGLTTTESAPALGTWANTMGKFGDPDSENVTVKTGDIFTLSIEKINNIYVVTYYTTSGTTYSQTLYYNENGEDQMLQIDKENIYVGFAVARGCNASFSDITVNVTERSTEVIEKPKNLVDPVLTILSASTFSGHDYSFDFLANCDGVLTAYLDNEKVIDNYGIIAFEKNYCPITLKDGSNDIKLEFTPDPDYKPDSESEMSSYETQKTTYSVYVLSFGTPDQTIIVSPTGNSLGTGSYDKPLDIFTALAYLQPGQTILMLAGEYKIESEVMIARGNSGAPGAYKTLVSDPASSERAVINFNRVGTGFNIWGDYWYIKGIDCTNAAEGYKGMQVSGNYNVIELVNTYNNGNTGLQISGRSAEPNTLWPTNNLILNCTSYNNADAALEDADGFAAKLTCGAGNVFRGCIAYNNADDGWDMFAKIATGPIGAVVVENCVTFNNGYLLDGTNAGNGNGFKMGGSGIQGAHVLRNSISFNNKGKGIDSNSCPDIKVYNSTSFNNGSYNVALYGNSGSNTDFVAEGVISFRTENLSIGESIKLVNQSSIDSANNYFWNGTGSFNIENAQITEDMFVSLDTSIQITRDEDGSINMHGLLELNENAPADAGARLVATPSDIIINVDNVITDEPVTPPDDPDDPTPVDPSEGVSCACDSEIGTPVATLTMIVMSLISVAAVILIFRKKRGNNQ